MLKIASALEAAPDLDGENPPFKGVPIIYIRFNPHFYEVDGIFYDPSLSTRHEQLLNVLKRLESQTIELPNVSGLNIFYRFRGSRGARNRQTYLTPYTTHPMCPENHSHIFL